jgi:hypothetical protein
MLIIQLAHHIFSICPNSASCKRLFSAFSNILTKVQNHMGKDTLQMLTKVKMHVHDEHLTHIKMKTRLKHHFGTVDLSFNQPQVGPFPPSLSSSTQPSNVMEASQIPPVSSTPGFPGTALNPDISNDTTESNTKDTPTDNQSAQFLSTIIDQFIQQGELDGMEEFPPIIKMDQLMTYPPISLDELFDFSWDYWVRYHQRAGHHSLNEELEVYNLLDADLPSEEGTEVEIDDMAGDILTLNLGNMIHPFLYAHFILQSNFQTLSPSVHHIGHEKVMCHGKPRKPWPNCSHLPRFGQDSGIIWPATGQLKTTHKAILSN